MDHARKIGKSDKPFLWRKSPSPPCSISDKPLIADEELTEDRRLANWRKWIADRKKHYRSYSASTDRDSENLLMNTPEKFRRTVETRNLMECAGSLQALSKRAGKFPSDAGFWLTPEFLPKHGNPDLPDIPITLTKKQLTFAPDVERIALPELIQREMGLPVQKYQKPPGKRSEYLKTQTKLLSRELKSLEAKEPEIGKLAIRGQRLGRTISEALKIPIVTIAGVDASESSKPSIGGEDSAIVMKIQDRTLKFADKDTVDEELGRFALIFRSSGSAAVERTIRLENRGTCTIIYRWRYGSQGSTLIPSTPRSSQFFFNKNKDLLLPGQVTLLRVWFRSRIPCSATEFWTLTTEPKICHAPLIFRFWGCCSFAPLNEAGLGVDPGSIERYLDRRIRDTAIHEIIGRILDDVGTTGLPSPAYKSLFVEGEIFRAKNPSYFYHPEVIRELRNVYDNATSKDSPAWDLSLDDLRRILLQLSEPRVRNDALLRFYEFCRDCLVPSLCNPPGNSKISMVHNLLCSFANKFEAETEHVRTKCSRGNNESRTRSDASRSASVSGASQVSLTRRRKSRKSSQSGKSVRTRSTSKASVSTPNNRDTAPLLPSAERNKSECFFYKEVLYVRVREMLRDTIGDICGIVDSFNNLSGLGKIDY